MSLKLTVRTPLDMVAIAPIVLGFIPEDSVFLMVTESAGGRQFHARMDMPRCIEDCDTVADQLLPVLEREGVTGGVLTFFTSRAQVAEYADLLIGRWHRVTFHEVLHATPTHYRSLRCTDLTCCPTEGKPYDITSHPAVAEAVLAGHVVLQTEDDVARGLVGAQVTGEVASSYRAHVDLARANIALLDEDHPNHDPKVMKVFWKGEALWVVETLRKCRAGAELTDAMVGRLAAALVPIQVRDAAWAEITRHNAEFFKEFFRDLTRRVPPETAAAPACMFAYAAWVLGDGASARLGVERAQEAEPGYSLAAILTHALSAGVRPDGFTPVPSEELPVWDVA